MQHGGRVALFFDLILLRMLPLTLIRNTLPTLGRTSRGLGSSFCYVHLYKPLCVTRFSSGLSYGTSLPYLGKREKLPTNCLRTSLSFQRNFWIRAQLDGRLLEMFETLQRNKKAKSKQDHLFASFGLVQKIQRENDVDELLEIHEILANEENFEPNEISVLSARVALLTRFAVLSTRDTGKHIVTDKRMESSIEKLLRTIRWNSSHCEPTHLASVVWAIATLGIRDKNYFIHFERELKARDGKLFTNADLAMILWAFGKAQFPAPQLFKMLRNEVMARDVTSLKVKEICHILWAFARTLEKGAKLFAVLKDEIMKRDLSEFEERSLVIILWSFSEVGHNVKPLFRHIKGEMFRRGISSFSDMQLAQIVSSYANQGIRSPDLFQEISAEILYRGDLRFDPLGIVMVAAAFAKTKNYIRELFQLLETHLKMADLSVFDPLQLIRLLLSFCEAGLLQETFLRKFSGQILLCNFSELSDTSLGELVQVLEKCRFQIPELVAATEAELVRRSEAQE